MFLERRRPVRRPAAPTTRRSPRTPPTRRARRKTTTRARAPRPREGEASRRARSASASHKTRRSPGGGDPRRSRSRGGRHPALASRTFPRGQGHRGTATTEALGRRARLGAASLAATPRDALTCRRPSNPPRVSGRALASGRHAPRKPVALQACALRHGVDLRSEKSKLSVRGRKVPNTQAAARVDTRPRARGAGSARRRVRVRFAFAGTTTAVPRVASLERSGGPSSRGVRA